MLFENRTAHSKDVWVIDASEYLPIDELCTKIQDIQIDFDDDVLIMSNLAIIWEIYKISQNSKIKKKEIGKIDKSAGIMLDVGQKWSRRRNLFVRLLVIKI